LVILYTDGVTEQGGPNSKKLSDEQLLEMARTVNVTEHATLGSSLLAASDAMLDRRADLRDDDATVLVLHHNGARPPAVSLGHRLRMIGKMMGL
jgi:serine phosphatase RsbU (regulator of sigma subunit)